MAGTLHPDAQRVLDLIRMAGRPAFDALTPQAARAIYRDGRTVLQPDPEDVVLVRDLAAPGPGGDIPLRLYRAADTEDQTALQTLI